MWIIFFVFAFPAFAQTVADPQQSNQVLSDEQKKQVDKVLEQTLQKAVHDPQVIEVVKQAQEDKKNKRYVAPVVKMAQSNSDEQGWTAEKYIYASPQAAARYNTASPQAEPRIRMLGALIDIGVPEVVGLSLVFRPWRWLRTHAGLTHDTGSFGLRAGATVMTPFDFFVNLSLTGEVGHVFPGDLSWIARLAKSSDQSFESLVLRSVTYNYATGHLGLEFGSPNRALFYIHAGVSYMNVKSEHLQEALQVGANDKSLTLKSGNIEGVVPTGKIGLVIYFY